MNTLIYSVAFEKIAANSYKDHGRFLYSREEWKRLREDPLGPPIGSKDRKPYTKDEVRRAERAMQVRKARANNITMRRRIGDTLVHGSDAYVLGRLIGAGNKRSLQAGLVYGGVMGGSGVYRRSRDFGNRVRESMINQRKRELGMK